MGTGHQNSASSSSTSASSTPEHGAAWSSPRAKKRPAGRTKFRETRHPFFRGVRRRGSAGRWVCEVRVPGNRGARLWLGTYVTTEAAARAHDAAMLALRGCRPATASGCLNFPDSAWLLAVPPSSLSDLADVRRAATEAVAGFLHRRDAAAADEVTSSVPAPSLADNASQAAMSPVTLDMAVATLDGDVFELDLFGEMDLDTYYANLAEGLLMEPPAAAATGSYWDNDDAAADVALWSY